MTVPAGVYGVDFLDTYPDPQLLWDRGVRFVALYLKAWRTDWVLHWLAIGGWVIPIMEVSADQAALGPAQGAKDAAWGVTHAQLVNIPANATVPIIMTQDSSNWDPVNHPGYFAAAEPVLRAGGYLNGGYGGKDSFNDCIAHGVTFDLMWQTNATGWFHGRHPDAHAWQGGHGNVNWWNALYNGTQLDVTGMGNVDTDVAKRPFPAWSLASTYTPGADMPVVVTNAEQFFTAPPNVWKAVIREDDGLLRHIEEPEWHAMGSPAGFPLTNAQIVAQGIWTPPAPTPPVVQNPPAPTSFSGTIHLTAP